MIERDKGGSVKIDETKLINREYKIADLVEEFIMNSPNPDETTGIILRAAQSAFMKRGMRDSLKSAPPEGE